MTLKNLALTTSSTWYSFTTFVKQDLNKNYQKHLVFSIIYNNSIVSKELLIFHTNMQIKLKLISAFITDKFFDG